jgi:hypothetical protein
LLPPVAPRPAAATVDAQGTLVIEHVPEKPAELPATATSPVPPATKASSETGKETPDSYQPDTLDPQTAKLYSDSINELRNRQAALVKKLAAYLRDHGSGPHKDGRQQAEALLAAVLPVACLSQASVATFNPAARRLADRLLPGNYASAANRPASLVNVTPRNELNAVATLLYAHSNLPLRELSIASEDWQYEQKAEIVQLFLNNQHQPVELSPLEQLRYRWDFVAEYGLFYELKQLGIGSQWSWQQLTPRLGFEVPKIIDDAELTEAYEDCFDKSLQLYSQLQQKGFETEAQYTALQGHKLRWNVSYTAAELQTIIHQLSGLEFAAAGQQLFAEVQERLSETHPLVAAAIMRRPAKTTA